ncbi:hypothetical protein SLS58_007793 [Diplodia intermedia]|uniref:F-box domain-containing protein n=1 Tax=Diplodia intermedia TaxID=856260 RepID=A0ABR3TJ81_9PEZI
MPPELPEDVLFLIVKELNLLHRREIGSPPPTLLSQYAGVGRTWNAIIERKTFSHLRVYSPGHQRPISPARFKQLMDRDPARWDALSTVSFYAGYPVNLCSERGRSEAGMAVNNEHFSSSVREFWKVLETLDAPDGKARDLLFNTAQVPYDNSFVPGADAYLHLVGEPLPRLRCLTGFCTNLCDSIWPSSLMHLAASIDGLTTTRLIFDDDIKDLELLRRYREDLGRCISQTPTSCTDFSADFGYYSSGFDEMPAVAPSTPDTLCIQLRSLSMCLRHLNLEHLRVSPALFWPTTDEQLGDGTAAAFVPSWPNLESITLILAPLDSYGHFYADPSPEELESQLEAREIFQMPSEVLDRQVPRPERGLHQLIVAAGQAVRSGMPRLQWLRMEQDNVGPYMNFSVARHPTRGDPFHLDWHSEPPVPLTEEVLRTWGLEWEACREYWDKDDPPGWYKLSAVLP